MRNRGRGRKFGRLIAATGGSFSPSSLAGLSSFPIISLARAAGLLWQDTAETVPAVADNDPVAVINDTFSSIKYTRITDDTHRAILNTSSGKWWLTFDGVDDGYSFSGPSCAAGSPHFAFRSATVAVAGIGVDGPANSFKGKLTDSSNMRGGKEGVANWTSGSTTTLVNATDYTGGFNYGATGDGRYFLNGADDGLGVADITTQAPTGNWSRIGLSEAAAERFSGRLYGWAIYSAKQTAADIAAIHAFLRTFMP